MLHRSPTHGFLILFPGVQSPTSTHLSLDLPYVFFGLGRTYSYIEEFHCGAYNQQVWNSSSVGHWRRRFHFVEHFVLQAATPAISVLCMCEFLWWPPDAHNIRQP